MSIFKIFIRFFVVFISIITAIGANMGSYNNTGSSKKIQINSNIKKIDEDEIADLYRNPPTYTELKNYPSYSYVEKKYSETDYRIFFFSNQHVVMIYYETSSPENRWTTMFTPTISEDEFKEKVQRGISLEKVRKLDPGGDYIMLDVGNVTFNKTFHITTDGCFCTLSYDDHFNVKSIDLEKIA